MSRLVIDPVTRAGGQLRVDAEVSSGTVSDAWVSATMFRGIETVLPGRDPRDVWLLAQRVCGTCTSVHALASVRAVERALAIQVPKNARLVRNIMAGALLVRDHVMVLYQRALPDWVDIGAAATADPAEASRLALSSSAWPNSSPSYFGGVRDRLAAMVKSGDPGLFGSGASGHPGYRLSPAQSLLLMAHMLEAFDWQVGYLRLEALLGGKDPHPQTYLVGGMALAPPWGGPAASKTRQHPQVPDKKAPGALSPEGLQLIDEIVASGRAFVEQVYVPDFRLLAAAYPDYAKIGAGPGSYLAFGDYPLDDALTPALYLPSGRLMQGNLEAAQPVVEAGVAESVVHAWYTDVAGDITLQRPADGQTSPQFTGSIPLETLDGSGKYTWIKGARYDGIAVEAGPLARLLVGAANGQEDIRRAVAKMLDETGLDAAAMPSVIGRMLARTVEAQLIGGKLHDWVTELRASLATGDVAVANIERWDPASWPSEAEGWSLGEGPRGAVGHWVGIRDGQVSRYQIVDGSTFNVSPRDALGLRGTLEFALRGLTVADPAKPLEILRVLHSIAPCAACAAHVHHPRPGGEPTIRIHAAEAIR
jgi:hydrogenase large subunit